MNRRQPAPGKCADRRLRTSSGRVGGRSASDHWSNVVDGGMGALDHVTIGRDHAIWPPCRYLVRVVLRGNERGNEMENTMKRVFLRIGGVALALALALVASGQLQPTPAEAAPAHARGAPYYLALGDSLSQGVQPLSASSTTDVVTNQGYVDDLYAYYKIRIPGLNLEKLGCPGESTTSMINGGGCSYSLGSQLAEAVSFLKHHRVVLLTFDIGPNDVSFCLGAMDIAGCVAHQLQFVIGPNLTNILTQLRQAGPHVPMFAMNFYDPYLGLWNVNQTLAAATVPLTENVNSVEEGIYADFNVHVANVERTFHTTNFTLLPQLGLPLNVALICAWTWACGPNHNIHANATGYAVIAVTFEGVIRGRLH